MPKQYIYKPTGAKATPERWVWRVQYRDGTELRQFDGEGYFHRFAEIDMPQVAIFQMLSWEGLPPVTFIVSEGDKLVHFYRRLGLDYMGEHRREVLYVFGIERAGRKTFGIIGPTDEVVITDDPDNVTVE